MGNKKVIIITGIIALLAVGAVIFAVANRDKTETTTDTETDQNTGTTNDGDVVVVTPSPTPFGREGFKVSSDPANPYAANLPRSNEPVPAANNFDDYEDAVDSGQIPDQNGNFAQKAGTNPLSFVNSNGTNYSLSSEAFLGQYYPNLEDLITTGSAGSSGTTTTGAPNDPNAVLVEYEDNSNIPDTIPLFAGVDVTMFSTVADSKDATVAYAKEISKTTAPLDVVFEEKLVNELLDQTNQATLDTMKKQALLIQNQIRAVKVPQQYVGMSQAYYKLYGDYAKLIDRQSDLIKVKTKAQYDQVVAAYQTDLQPFGVSYAQVLLDAEIMKKQLGQ